MFSISIKALFYVVLLSATALLLPGSAAKLDSNKTINQEIEALETLQGSWVVISVEADGELTNAQIGQVPGDVITFSYFLPGTTRAPTVTMFWGSASGRAVGATQIRSINEKTSPKQIDIETQLERVRGTNKIVRWGHKSEPAETYTTELLLYGIYKIERDGDLQTKLTYCIGAHERSRPNEFSVPQGSHRTLIHLKRQKEVAVLFDSQTPDPPGFWHSIWTSIFALFQLSNVID